jgi:hypothetical protein
LFSVFVFLDTTPATVYYNNIKGYISYKYKIIRLVNSYLNREIDRKEFKVRMCAYYADSRDKTLFYSIHRLNHFPINFKITKYDWRIYAKNRKEKVKLKT